MHRKLDVLKTRIIDNGVEVSEFGMIEEKQLDGFAYYYEGEAGSELRTLVTNLFAANKPVIRSLKKYHGKPGSGAGVEFQIKAGPITMLSIGQTANGQFKFVIAEGESLDHPIPPTGNTNTHGVFKPDVRTFLKRWCAEGPTHHFALGIGHHAESLIEIAKALDIEYVVTTPESPKASGNNAHVCGG